MNHIWNDALDATTEQIFDRGNVREPPVDALQLARRLGFAVLFDRSQPVRARRKTIDGKTTIFLQPEERPERMHWALAHEIGESFAWQVAQRIEEPPRDAQREEIANRLAARLLLPAPWFERDARECDFDLRRLKARYRTASHALIALRFLDLQPTAIVTLFDHCRPSCRKSNRAWFPCRLLPAERAAVEAAHTHGVPAFRTAPGCSIRAWPVHEPGWKREIVHVMYDEGFEGECAGDEWPDVA